MTDVEEIRDLLARYNLYGDSGRIDDVLELFADDATLVTDEASYDGRAQIRQLFESAVGPQPQRVQHFTGTHVIDVSGDTATARCYFQVLTDDGLDHWGRYRDQLVRVEGRWRFARREVRVDGQRPFGWAASRRLEHGHDEAP